MKSKINTEVIAEFGPIKIRRGFGKFEKNKYVYPKDRLIRLINLNLDNEEDVIKFCEDYKLLVAPINDKYSEGVKKILKPLKEIIDYFIKSNDLLPEYLDEINKHLEGVKYQLSKLDLKNIMTINYLLDPSPESYDYQIESNRTPQFGFVSRDADSVVSLWKDFSKFIVRNQKFKNCAGCGKYFIEKPKSHNQRYCSINCQEKYKKKRQYHNRK